MHKMRLISTVYRISNSIDYSSSHHNYYLLCNPRSLSFKILKSYSNRVSVNALSSDIADGEIKQTEKGITEPKKTLWRIVNQAYGIQQNPNIKPSITMQQVTQGKTNQNMWQVSITMTWPRKFRVESIAIKKSDAEKNSYMLACQKMKDFGILDCNNHTVLPENIRTFEDNNVENSKSVLCNIYQCIWTRFGKKEYIPKFNTVQIPGLIGNDKLWKSELTLSYPEIKSFECHAGRLREAEKIVSARALLWLKEIGLINNKKRLISYSKEDDIKLLKLHSSSYSISIPELLQKKMTSLLLSLNQRSIPLSTDILNKMPDENHEETIFKIYDIITEKPYERLSEEEVRKQSEAMFKKNCLLLENNHPEFKGIKELKKQLPIFQKREDILQLIDENQVLVISGETGCGKTTQVPQFILDHHINRMEGAQCNVVVTQPRRISAISMAERVASERGEKVGKTVGYQIRLNKLLPSQKGAILYCSTGMLLRKLCSNPSLDGVSHVIVDEVHERNIQIDFLLILLKRLLETNKKIKLLIMSASFNTCIFSRYFNDCPVIHVPGRNYPVKDYFLEEILVDMKCTRRIEQMEPQLDSNLVVDVINHIDKFQAPGAILCFLPGWSDILSVKNNLLSLHPDPSKLKICCAHSRLPHEEQKELFNKPPPGVRKVILATNIAETSITINDVVFVVNSGLQKETTYDSEQAVASLATQWITKASVRQRRGRAGRVQPGICYHLFSRKSLMAMEEYPQPELLRMPLESVILDCKRYSESKAEDFLSTALQAPSKSCLQAGVEELQTIGILDEDEHLTSLGKIVVNFGTHPRLSVALVFATFFKCLDPVLTICSILTLGKEPFSNTLEDKTFIKNIKKAYDNSLISDHLSLLKIYDEWKKYDTQSNSSQYIEQNFLDEKSLNLISDLKSLFAENLYTAGMIDAKDAFNDAQNVCNENSHQPHLIFSVLTKAVYPNIIKILQGEISQNRFNKEAIVYSLLKGQRGYIQKESVASNECELPSPWLIYFSALQSKARRLMMTSAVSCVPGIIIPLLSGKQLQLCDNSSEDDEKKSITLKLDEHKKLTFSCSKEEAELVMQFRNELNEFFQIYIQSLHTESHEHSEALSVFHSEFLPVLKKVLETPQAPFTRGQTYKFIDGNLISKDL